MLQWHKHDLDRASKDLAVWAPGSDKWTEEDKLTFEEALQAHGKSFHRISEMLQNKSTRDVVEYYNRSSRSDKKVIGLLNYAMKNGKLNILHLLLADDRIDVNMTDENGDSLLLLASAGGFVAFVSTLLESPRIEVNKCNADGDTPLMCAANEGYNVIVDLLLKRKDIDVNCKNSDHVTSLMCAADKGFERTVKLLLSHREIDINLKVNINPGSFFLSFSHFPSSRIPMETFSRNELNFDFCLFYQ